MNQAVLKYPISLWKAKQLIKKAEIEIQEEHVYIIYECGHVIDGVVDARVIKWLKNSAGQGRTIRVCPVCYNSLGKKFQLITKYKRCGCGAEHLGKKLLQSVCCSSCPSYRKLLKGEDYEKSEKVNGHLADPERCFCIHRDKCLKEYVLYEAIPCKNCKKFKEKVLTI